CFQYLGYTPESLPETYRASREVLSLPIFPELTEREQQLVVRSIKSYFDLNAARHSFPATTAIPVRKRDAA
ncbi:MAG: DegT/DnrJ/EryC1/StrS family aminotransferase, partial [Planctomycetaceae bacterium]|nr:DegT/DnrJ/EryC1/StrS family aminotransferase [Planctomycetaceae bacterium]